MASIAKYMRNFYISHPELLDGGEQRHTVLGFKEQGYDATGKECPMEDAYEIRLLALLLSGRCVHVNSFMAAVGFAAFGKDETTEWPRFDIRLWAETWTDREGTQKPRMMWEILED